jgi:hypothetical protein
MYVASIHEAYLVAQNREKFHSVFKYIDKTLRPVNEGTDSGNIVKYLASYGGDTGEGFSTLHDRLYGSFAFGSSNLYYRHDVSTQY